MRRPRILPTLFRLRCPCLAQLCVSDPRDNSAPASSAVGGDNRTVDYPPRVPPLRRSFARCTSATTTSNSRHSVPFSLERHPHHRRPPSRSRSRSRSRPSTFSHRWPRARAPARSCRLSPSPVRVGRLRSSWPSPSENATPTRAPHTSPRVSVVEHVVSKRDRGAVFEEDDDTAVVVVVVAMAMAMATAARERDELVGERGRRFRPKASAART